jgi:hypothetical protein
VQALRSTPKAVLLLQLMLMLLLGADRRRALTVDSTRQYHTSKRISMMLILHLLR